MLFDPSFVAFCITTHYPKWYSGKIRSFKHTDKVRGDIAIQFLKKASMLGYHIVVADGHSTKTFRKKIDNLERVKLIRRRTIRQSPGKRIALSYASKIPGVKVLVFCEAEKLSFLEDCIKQVVDPIIKDEADIVVPQRQEVLFKNTYPLYQYESETEANILYNEVLRAHGLLKHGDSDLDFFFGPRVFKNSKEVVNLFLRKYQLSSFNLSLKERMFDLENYSNTLYFSVDLALHKGFRVKSIEVPFAYHPNQKKNEEVAQDFYIEKRRKQKLFILIGLFHFLGFLRRIKGSRIKSKR